MKNQNKTKLWQFDVPLYPRKLWVAVGDDPKTISRKLTISDATKEVLSNAIVITTTARDEKLIVDTITEYLTKYMKK